MGRLRVKYGTFAQFTALTNKNADTLYFITDRGLVYKGSTLMTSKILISISGAGGDQVITITDNSTSSPTAYSVYSASAINAILTTLNTAIGTHRQVATGTNADGKATNSNYGHVELNDAIDSDLAASNGGTAATPKAVKSALQEAKDYTDTQMGNLSGAMIFKGTMGDAAAYNSSSAYDVGAYCTYPSGATAKLYCCITAIGPSGEAWNASHWDEVYRDVKTPPTTHSVGWVYEIVATGIYAGKSCEPGDRLICLKDGTSANDDDWTVSQANINGAVTSQDNLEEDALVLGAGNNRRVKKLAPGTTSYWLQQTEDGPAWVQLKQNSLGQGFFYSSTAAATAAKTVAAPGFVLTEGGIIAVRFNNGINVASATLNVNSTGAVPLYYRGQALLANVVRTGETVTCVCAKNNNNYIWWILGIDKNIPTAGNGISISETNVISVDADAAPTQNSTKPVTSGGTYQAIANATLNWETIS